MNQRQPRLYDPGYLAWLRRQGCACGCGRSAPSQAAHIRSGSIAMGKPWTGMQEKPSDFWAVPLNASCHVRQHAYGNELGWWAAHGKDPFKLAISYYAEYQSGEKPARKPRAKGPRKIKKRKPRGQRAQIRGRSTFERRNPFPKGGFS